MKILVIVESINVEDSSASKGRVALIYSLQKLGYQLRVLHYSRKEIKLDGIQTIMIKERKWNLNYLLSRFVRITQRHTKLRYNHHLEKIFGFSFTHTNDTKSIAKSIKEHKNFNPDLIITLSKGISFRAHRAMLRFPELHSIWLSYIHDPYPYHFYPRPFNKVESGYKYKESLMKEIIEKSRFLAFPSQMLKDWMQSYFPKVEHKSYIFPHQIKTLVKLPDLPDFFQKNEFSLLHAGNLLEERNPKFLIEGFLSFLKNNPSACQYSKLYFVGNFSRHIDYLNDFMNHPNIVIKGYIEYDRVQAIEKEAAVNIILEAVSEISPFLPGKFPNCVKVNKPILVLGPYYSEVKRLLGNDYPFWSEANDVRNIEEKITQLFKQWSNNPYDFSLNRDDLIDYCNEKGLEKVFNTIPIN